MTAELSYITQHYCNCRFFFKAISVHLESDERALRTSEASEVRFSSWPRGEIKQGNELSAPLPAPLFLWVVRAETRLD